MTRSFTLVGRIAFAILPLACGRQPQAHPIEMRQFKFEPAAIEVRSGDTLVFTNHDIVPHTATARDTSWNTGEIAANATTRIVVTGNAHYFCLYHPNMTASVELE